MSDEQFQEMVGMASRVYSVCIDCNQEIKQHLVEDAHQSEGHLVLGVYQMLPN